MITRNAAVGLEHFEDRFSRSIHPQRRVQHLGVVVFRLDVVEFRFCLDSHAVFGSIGLAALAKKASSTFLGVIAVFVEIGMHLVAITVLGSLTRRNLLPR